MHPTRREMRYPARLVRNYCTQYRQTSRTLLYHTVMLVLTLKCVMKSYCLRLFTSAAPKLILQQLNLRFSNREFPRFKNICLRCHSALKDKENQHLNPEFWTDLQNFDIAKFYEKLSSHFSFD